MANVLFKRGLENALFGLSTYEDGCFYLTEDTHRLYVGQGKALVPVNEGVITVDNVASLPKTGTTGSFYYASAENILCVYNGMAWVQINANTDTYYKVTEVELKKSTAGKKISLTSIITMKKYDNSSGVETEIKDSELTVSSSAIDITGSDLIDIIGETKVGLVHSLANNTFTLKNDGLGADTEKIAELIAGTNVTFAASSNGITISSSDTNTTYTLSTQANGTDKAQVVLTPSNEDGLEKEETVVFAANDKLNVKVDTNGEIVYGHDEIEVSRPAATTSDVKDRQITVVTGVSDDGYGHMQKITTQTFTLPEDRDIYVNGATYTESTDEDNGKLTLTREGDSDIVVDLGWTATKISGEIEDRLSKALRDLTALNYKGTVGTGATVQKLPGEAAAGDMYMAASDSSDNLDESAIYKIGDLIIATGEEVDGVIADPVWTVVPSGDELHTDTQFGLKAATDDTTNNAQLKLINETLSTVKDVINLSDDDIVKVEQKSNTEINFSHATKTVETATGTAITGAHGGTFNVITGVEADTTGHLSKVTTSAVTLPPNKDTTYELSADVTDRVINGVTNKVASIILTETLDGVETEDKVEIISSNPDIVIAPGVTDQIKISHGTHAGTKNKSETRTSLEYGAQIDVVTDITLGTNGHVNEYTVTPYTLPAEKIYTIEEDVSAETEDQKTIATITTTLEDGVNPVDTASHSISSKSLNITVSDNEIAVNLVWGTF